MRATILLALVGLVLTASCSPAGPEPGKAEQLFRLMEAEMAKARTLECTFEYTLQACPGARGKGSILLAEGNKHRLEYNSPFSVSDGKKMLWAREAGRPDDVPPWLNRALTAGFSRMGGLLTPILLGEQEGKDFKADVAFRVADFKLGEKEAIGVRQGQQIRYILLTKGPAPQRREARLTVSLWVDTKTKLPLKRVVAAREKDMDFILTETYSRLTLGGKIDPKKFELPKE